MNILVTGAKGMVGTALCNNLKNIRDGKTKTRPALDIKEIYEYDLDSTPAELDEYCQKADFVFNLAGVNRPENPEDFMKGNFGFASDLLNCLKKHNNKATIMLSSSIQVEAAKVSVAKAKGAYLPTLSLSGGIGTNYYTTSNVQSPSFGEQLRNNFSQYIGVSLNVPIFSRFSTRNAVRGAELNLRNSALQLESVKKSLYKEIQQAYYNALTSQSRYASSRESSSSAEQYYQMIEQKYLAGKAGITDYNDAKNSYLKAKSEFLQARYECLFQTELLDFYKGGEIVF